MFHVPSEHSGEAVVSGEEHAGSPTSRSLHHGATRSVLHGAMDRRIRLSEPGQVRKSSKSNVIILSIGIVNSSAVHIWVSIISGNFVYNGKMSVCVCVHVGSRSGWTSRGKILKGSGSFLQSANLPTQHRLRAQRLTTSPNPERPKPWTGRTMTPFSNPAYLHCMPHTLLPLFWN